MTNPKVSVIVPLYNTRQFIKSCLRSIMRQTYRNLEIIVVNDCSTDESLQIAQKVTAGDNRVKIIDKPVNEGLSRARFTGLDNATGDYVTFVDADDWIELETLAKMVEAATKHQVDVVHVQMKRWLSRRFRIKKAAGEPAELRNRKYTYEQLIGEYLVSYFGINLLSVNAWGCLYASHVIKAQNVRPYDLFYGEDLMMTLQVIKNCKNGLYIADYHGYNYRWGGGTSKYQPDAYKNARHQYVSKLNEIDVAVHPREWFYATVELKNCIINSASAEIEYVKDMQAVIDKLQKELDLPVYDNFSKALMHERKDINELSRSVYERDAAKIVALLEAKVSTDRKSLRNKMLKVAKTIIRRLG